MMIYKTKRIVISSLTLISAVILTAGAIAKIMKVEQVVESFDRLGVGQYTQLLGCFEIILLAVFLIPKTMRTGFILLCCYFGGAIATHLSHGNSPLQPVIVLTALFITAYVREPSIFFLSALRIRPHHKD